MCLSNADARACDVTCHPSTYSGLCVGCCGRIHVNVLQLREESAFTPAEVTGLLWGYGSAFTLQSREPQMSVSLHSLLFYFEMKCKGQNTVIILCRLFLVVVGIERSLVHARQALCH